MNTLTALEILIFIMYNLPIYNLIKYNDNYADTSGSLWQLKRDKSPVTSAANLDNVSANNSSLFKYKSSLFKSLEAAYKGVFKNVKIAVPVKYLSRDL